MTINCKLSKVIKYEKGLFWMWVLFTLFCSLSAIGIDLFFSKDTKKLFIDLTNQEIMYMISLSLIAAYFSDVVSILKINGKFLGVQKLDKEFFNDQFLYILVACFFIVVLMILAYLEPTSSFCWQLIFYFITLYIGAILFTLKNFDLVQERVAEEELKKAEKKADNNVAEDISKIIFQEEGKE